MLESLSCDACATPIAFHDETQTFVDVSGGAVLVDGRLWRACGNHGWQCNWLVEDGIATIDLAETLDAHREALRVRLGEPYRTLLGHFRHEIGHYYQSILLGEEALLAECRELFGDERASYRDALDHHYRFGAPEGWSASYISEYATMHPWEDFDETFAHYLHILGSLWTAAASNVHLQPSTTPLIDYTDEPIERVLADWHEVSLLLNRFSRAMGQNDLYPFVLNAPTEVKLGFMHRIVTRITRRSATTS
ncbi:putative zinc-binding metallopeptidase [Pseudoclavibacter helvolus]|uniref:putative zinc-binding metallopeptidase n=1 Tax=Pseudoclavibacter helvolus TaxID=255205 RepID=UPI003735E72C